MLLFTRPYNFDASHEKQSQSRNRQVFHLARYAVFKNCFRKIEVWLTQSKMLLTARSAMKRFPLTTLIRLYELLKNSRLKPQMRHQQQRSLAHSELRDQAALVLSVWWRMTGSNRRPPACKAGALPAELIPRIRYWMGWWVWLVSNQRPPPYQDGALTN